MILRETPLSGVWTVEPERHRDQRGHFARTFCAEAFAERGLPTSFPQASTSFNARRGTLRGLHWQDEPHPEGKLVRCTAGAVFDVAVDLRPWSPTRHCWVAVELSAANGRSLFIPPGFAHGFQALADDAELSYHMSERHIPGLARGARWDDPAFSIAWPIPNPILSDRDRSHKLQARAA